MIFVFQNYSGKLSPLPGKTKQNTHKNKQTKKTPGVNFPCCCECFDFKLTAKLPITPNSAPRQQRAAPILTLSTRTNSKCNPHW